MNAEDSDNTRLQRLEARLRTLEDVNAIRNLKARYAELCDDNYAADGIAALFTEDAVWESEGLGSYHGREAIREFFRGASKIFTFAIHYSLNCQIEVDGDTAQAQWYTFMPCTLGAGNRAMWRAGVDKEKYVRIDDRWFFVHKRSAPRLQTPFEEGWSKARFG